MSRGRRPVQWRGSELVLEVDVGVIVQQHPGDAVTISDIFSKVALVKFQSGQLQISTLVSRYLEHA